MALSPDAQRRIATFAPPLLVALVALPFLLRQNSWWEWTTAYWLLERQTEYVSAHGAPTLFLHTNAGAFYPFYAFYGGFTLSVLAYPAAIFGAWPVFAATCVLAPVAGYLGIWWTGRNLGLSHWLAPLPGLAFAASPYMVTDLYGRGSWAELVAANAVPFVLGGLTDLLSRDGPPRLRAVVTLAGSTAVIAGTHNISLMLAGLVLPLLTVPLLLASPARTIQGGSRFVARRLGLATLSAALGAGLTGAWLIPNLWFGRETFAALDQVNQTLLQNSIDLTYLGAVLSPVPNTPAGTYLYGQPPILSMSWAVGALVVLVVLAALRRRHDHRLLASAAWLVAVSVGLVVLVTRASWWSHFPDVLQAVQNPTRLLPYIAIAGVTCIAVVLVAIPPGRIRAPLVTILVVVVGVQVFMAARIAIDTQSLSSLPSTPLEHEDIQATGEPPAFASQGLFPPYQFRVALPANDRPQPTQKAGLDITDVITSRTATLSGTGAVGDRLLTAVIWSRFVRVDGDLRVSGHSDQGEAIVTVTKTAPDGRWSATVTSRCTGLCLNQFGSAWQLPAGRLLTLFSAFVLLSLVVVLFRRRPRERQPEVEPMPLKEHEPGHHVVS